jgi:hypothetical protein
MRPSVIASLLSSWLLGACSFDLSRLYPPPRDGDSGIEMDASEEDVVVDVTSDGPPRPTCVALAENMSTRTIGGSLVIEGSTTRAESTVNPIESCTTASNGAPEIFYELQVQRGGTLVASTDVPNDGANCPLFADTIVSIQRGNCEMPGPVLACNDDGMDPTQCTFEASRTVATGLMPFDRVMIIVDGYRANAGPFRLTVTENPLNEVLPETHALAMRCGCSGPTLTGTTEEVPISIASDVGGGVQRELNTPGEFIGGSRTIMGTTVVGLAATIGIVTNEFRSRTACNAYSATFDLVLGNNVVRSFVIDRTTDTAFTPRLMFKSTPPIAFTPGTLVQIRLRATTAPAQMADRCGVTFSGLAAAGTISMLTTR